MDITNIKDAWAKNDINICVEKVKGEICSAAFDGTYISLVSSAGHGKDSIQYCTILDRDLKICASFELFPIGSLEVIYHVCTEQRGLVCGGSDGNIVIVKLQNWKPQQQLTAIGGLGGEITTMSTRHDLIGATSLTGEVALWNYAGSKVATIKLESETPIHSLSIGETRLLVVTDNDAYEYEIPTAAAPTTTPSILKLKKGGHRKLGKPTTWATYDPEEKNILIEERLSTAEQPLERFRPVLPLSSLDYDIHIISYKVKTKEVQGSLHRHIYEAYIVIEELNSGKTTIIRDFQVSSEDIQSLWCDKERLYWVHQGSKKIMMVDFTDKLNLGGNTSVKLGECFSLSFPAYR
ncbi:hypothetical protein B0O99DRAFT_682588 [Bisporella sp. PMI_857]|nr:hypothetical protein B0O99DRAFT_682588 [Bisporella sp. PMI_857]